MRRDHWLGFALFLGTLLLFAAAAGHEFVDYDDDLYVTENDVVKGGLTWAGVRWAFTTHHASNWHPVTWLSHMLDVELFGLRPAGHHATSVILHAANAALLFLLLRNLTGASWPAALAAALFAWHPLRVESVAWVAERKDVLSAFFGLFAMLACVGHAKSGNRRLLAASVAACALSLMAKPMLVTLPFVLLLLDFWPLRRMPAPARPDAGGTPAGAGGTRQDWKPLLMEKVPFLALAIASSVVTVWAQRAGGSVMSLEQLPFLSRVGHALAAYGQYLRKCAWPFDLAVLYPLPPQLPLGPALGGAAAVIVLSGLSLRWWRERPWLAVGWFWFAGTLVPVIGLVQVGSQALADRYTYFPSMGLCLLAAWGGLAWAGKNAARLALVRCAAVAAVLMCAALTRIQLGVWQNSVTLFRNAVELTRDNDIAHNNLGAALLKRGETEAAAAHLAEAVRIRPAYVDAHLNLGLALTELKRFEEAKTHFRRAVDLRPDLPLAQYYAGVSLASDGDKAAARRHLMRAVELSPGDSALRVSVAEVLLRMKMPAEAASLLEEALPRGATDAALWHTLGLARLRTGKADEAESAWRRALAIEPDNAPALQSLARLRATHPARAGSGDAEAVRLAERARQLAGDKDPLALDTLAAAYANAGRFDDAVQTARRAADLARQTGQKELETEITAHLELYTARQPLREDPAAKP